MFPYWELNGNSDYETAFGLHTLKAKIYNGNSLGSLKLSDCLGQGYTSHGPDP